MRLWALTVNSRHPFSLTQIAAYYQLKYMLSWVILPHEWFEVVESQWSFMFQQDLMRNEISLGLQVLDVTCMYVSCMLEGACSPRRIY